MQINRNGSMIGQQSELGFVCKSRKKKTLLCCRWKNPFWLRVSQLSFRKLFECSICWQQICLLRVVFMVIFGAEIPTEAVFAILVGILVRCLEFAGCFCFTFVHSLVQMLEAVRICVWVYSVQEFCVFIVHLIFCLKVFLHVIKFLLMSLTHVLDFENETRSSFVLCDLLVDNKVVIVLASIAFELSIFCPNMVVDETFCLRTWESFWVVRDHFILSFVIHDQRNVLNAKFSQFHCFLDETSFSFAVCHISESKLVDWFELRGTFLSHTSFILLLIISPYVIYNWTLFISILIILFPLIY